MSFKSRDTAIKKEVARFSAKNGTYTSERDSASGDLIVHCHTDEFGSPAQTVDQATANVPIKSLADLQKAWNQRPHGNQRRA